MTKWRHLEPWLRDTPATFYLLPLLVFVVVPGVIAWNNDVSLTVIPAWSWLALFGLCGLFVLTFLVLRRLLRPWPKRAFTRIVSFGCYFVVASGFLFPTVASTEMIDPSSATVNRANLAASLSFAAIMLVFSETKYRVKFQLGLVIFVAVNAVLIVGASALGAGATNEGDAFSASASRNIFVLSFDDLGGSPMWDAIELDSDTRNALAGFTVYRGAASSSPATQASLAAELYGNQDFKSRYETVGQVWNSSPEDLITNVLAGSGFRVVTYGSYGTNLAESGLKIRPTGLAQTSALDLMNLSIARTFGAAFVPRDSVSDALQWLVSPPSLESRYEAELASEILNSSSPEWDRVLAATVLDFYEFVEQLRVGGDQPTAYFLHYTHTHWPVEFDDECSFKGDEPEWYKDNQNYHGTVLEAGCALKQFALFIEKLKSLGIFDQSMIVLKSDHGKPVGYAQPGSLESVRIENHRYLGISRYGPFLAIKPFGQSSAASGIAVNELPVLVDDLARTICVEAQVAHHCERYPGFNIVDETAIPPDSLITVFVPESESSDHRFRTHEAITFARGDDVLTSMYQALVAEGKVQDS